MRILSVRFRTKWDKGLESAGLTAFQDLRLNRTCPLMVDLRLTTQAFTGTAGVPPAVSAQRERNV